LPELVVPQQFDWQSEFWWHESAHKPPEPKFTQ